MNDVADQYTWDDLDDMLATGAFGALSPSDAYSVMSDLVTRPMAGGESLDLDAASTEHNLMEAYADATAQRTLESGLAYTDEVRRRKDADVIPAVCRAAGVSPDMYAMASAMRDDGDPSLMLDMYSAFVAGMVRGVRRGRR